MTVEIRTTKTQLFTGNSMTDLNRKIYQLSFNCWMTPSGFSWSSENNEFRELQIGKNELSSHKQDDSCYLHHSKKWQFPLRLPTG